jgi:hypothetical protein
MIAAFCEGAGWDQITAGFTSLVSIEAGAALKTNALWFEGEDGQFTVRSFPVRQRAVQGLST